MKQRLTLLTGLIVIILLTCHTTAMDIPTDGLVAYYSFDDGTATDNSGNGHDGQIFGAVITPGKSRVGLYFNGADAYVNAGYSSDFDLPTFTIGGWAKFTGSGDNYQQIISKHTNYGGIREGYTLVYVKDDVGTGGVNSNTLTFFTGSGGSGYNHIYSDLVESDRWYYVVGTYDGTEKCLYIDGILVGSSITNIGQSNTDLLIGCSDTPQLANYFRGVIDEVIIYNRTLSDSEISSLYDTYMSPRYTITASSTDGGIISPSGDITVGAGGSQVFNLLADKKYKPASITIDNITIDLKNLVVTFNNVLSDHTIHAEFTSPGKPPK